MNPIEAGARAILQTGYCERLCAGDHNPETCLECAAINARAAAIAMVGALSDERVRKLSCLYDFKSPDAFRAELTKQLTED